MTGDILILLNVLLFGWAFWETLKRIKRVNVRLWLRVPAAFIAGYIFLVYLLTVLGLIDESNIRYFMRWFQLVIAAYIVLEAKHG